MSLKRFFLLLLFLLANYAWFVALVRMLGLTIDWHVCGPETPKIALFELWPPSGSSNGLLN